MFDSFDGDEPTPATTDVPSGLSGPSFLGPALPATGGALLARRLDLVAAAAVNAHIQALMYAYKSIALEEMDEEKSAKL